MSGEELHDLIRQLRVELEWAVRTGIEPAPPPPPPAEAAPQPRRSPAEAAPHAGRAPEDGPSPGPNVPPADRGPPEPNRAERGPPPRPPDVAPFAGRPSAGAPPGPDRGSSSVDGSEPRRSSNPHRPWEAYLPEDGGRRPPGPDAATMEGSPNAGPPTDGPPMQARRPTPPSPPAPEADVTPGADDLAGQLAAAGSLDEVRTILGPCVRCKLHRLGRQKIVFGVGPPNAEVMFVGEGPGGDEDRIGEPFVGAAGQLLTRIIEAGMGMKRSDVYIANIVKCRPPRNRNPEPDEVEQCEPFLKAQIHVIRPRVLVALGKYAAQTLLRDSTPITRLRGRWREYEGIALMPTFHPAYLLRNPAEKRPVWEDIQSVLKFLGRPVPGRG